VEAGDHPARNVDSKCQPGSLQRLATDPINDDYIDQRMVDLYNLVGMASHICPGDWTKPVAHRFQAVTDTHNLRRIERHQPGFHRMPGWCPKSLRPAYPADFTVKSADSRHRPHFEKNPQRLVDSLFGAALQPANARPVPAARGSKELVTGFARQAFINS